MLEEPKTLEDESGSVIVGKICGSADSIVHTLIQRPNYNGLFLPGFEAIEPIEFCAQL